MMSNKAMREIIEATILSMERPFNVSDLFFALERKHSIQNRSLIMEVLDELCDSGKLSYSEINDDCWAFHVKKAAS